MPLGKDAAKGLMAAVLGLLLGTVGLDQLSGVPRYTFGEPWLLGGVDLIVILVGLYALPPVIALAESADLKGLSAADLKLESVKVPWSEVRGMVPTWLRSSLIGIGVGILPGAGGKYRGVPQLQCRQKRQRRSRKLWQRQPAGRGRRRMWEQRG